jgi:trehalose 6-phosphate phosphatase
MRAGLAIAELLEPLRADPAGSAALLDIDGTLAPIVRHASDANVPEPTRQRLVELGNRYRLVACVSGRSAAVARQIVSIGSIAYVGNHGCELLPAGATETILDPQVAEWAPRIVSFADHVDTVALQRLRVRREDKGPIVAFHWRGAPDEAAALAAVEEIETAAEAIGFDTRRGRKVLEVQPPVPISKGRGIHWLLAADPPEHGVYVGDDATDLDAFAGLRDVLGDGAVCIGVRSDETPPELEDAADAMVDGPPGVRLVLEELLRQ